MSSIFNNKGSVILGIIELILFIGLSIGERVAGNPISLALNGAMFVPVMIGAIILFTNKEFPIAVPKLILCVATFLIPLIVIAAIGASHYNQ